MIIPTPPDIFAEDCSFIYSLLEETMKEPTSTTTTTTAATKRRRQADEEELGNNMKKTAPKKKQKKEVLKELLTSFLLLEQEEQQEKLLESSDEIQQLIEKNHRQKKQTMIDYYNDLQDGYTDLEQQSDQFYIQQSRLSAASKIAAAAANKGLSAKEGKVQGGGNQRRLWVKDRSTAWWDQCSHPDYPEADFRKEFRMSKETFNLICDELSKDVVKVDTMLRQAIPVRQRVAVCIWRLATGAPLRHVSERFGLGISTCHKLVLEVCLAIKTVLMPKFLQWPDEEKLKSIEKEFESVSRIPNVVGSMYTTHIPIIAPKISVSAYFNKRHTERNQKTSYSITVQGVVDPKGVFTDVCIGWPGSMPDDQVLEKSALYQRANGGQLKGSWIVGSSGYPLMDWVLVPYTQQNLTWTQHAFNEKIGEVQRVGKSAFARLKGRWGCLQKRTEMKLQDLPVVLGACCVLHNICEMRNEEMDPDVKFELFDDEMIPENSLRSMSSIKTRDNIAHNLLHHGLAGTSFL
ncbi:protein ALP1-like isoform X1 [Papaver somniferum]|uniref:protein ALP1-like isoform X1 n=1 Tax=Papaver somniferum TaxID=3469 RepID=UPI000E6F979B|nr:protein ALP1-like isoform X1 [Papaver somniferum]